MPERDYVTRMGLAAAIGISTTSFFTGSHRLLIVGSALTASQPCKMASLDPETDIRRR